jgi:hypothetical protein
MTSENYIWARQMDKGTMAEANILENALKRSELDLIWTELGVIIWVDYFCMNFQA